VGAPGFAFSAPRAFVATSGNGLDYFGTVRGRLGNAFDRTLVCGTGGFAYGAGSAAPSSRGYAGNDSVRTGYAVGGGIAASLHRMRVSPEARSARLRVCEPRSRSGRPGP
ncbi:hypothetical protein MKL09_00950, partial [Methylobacterium sp. J-048]|nr:hypothetical protein [Methylobacterium sp. J-048]